MVQAHNDVSQDSSDAIGLCIELARPFRIMRNYFDLHLCVGVPSARYLNFKLAA